MITEKYISIVGAILLILLACYKIFKLRTVTNKEITDFKKEIGDSYYLLIWPSIGLRGSDIFSKF